MGEESIIGTAAEARAHKNSEHTIYHLRRLLGKSFNDVKSQEYVKNFPFELTEQNGKPVAKVLGDKIVTPVEFCSMLLSNLRELAEDYTGVMPEYCVMSVPANFTEEQKDLMKKAATESNINVIRFISEPIAAAISYGLDEKEGNDQAPEYVAVFDLGGATHNVSILNADKGFFNVLSSVTDEHLGGEDFTNAIVNDCIKSFERKTKIDIRGNKKAIQRLKVSAEATKRSLSNQNQVNLEVDSLADGTDFSMKVSRSRFEGLIKQDLKKAISVAETALEEADLDKEDIDRILLVGGSAYIPLLQTMVGEYFGKTPEVNATPDENIVFGATQEAATLAKV